MTPAILQKILSRYRRYDGVGQFISLRQIDFDILEEELKLAWGSNDGNTS